MKGKENKHFMAFRKTKLSDQETILAHLEGWIGEMMGSGEKKQHNGQFILTSKRICFYRKGILGEVFETMPIEKISSVETLSMMGYRVLRCHTANDELAFKTFEARELFEGLYNHLESLRPSGSSFQPTTAGSIADELAKLGLMREQGLLSEQEFVELKQRLINA